MRYTAREIAQEQAEEKRAAMLLANLIFDIRGAVFKIGRVDDETPAETVIEEDEMAAAEIDYAGSEALGVIRMLIDHLGVRSMDASLCEDCIEGHTQDA